MIDGFVDFLKRVILEEKDLESSIKEDRCEHN